MSIFSKIFGDSNAGNEDQSNAIQWIDLNDISQLDEIVAISEEKPVIIFKHSTRCSISRMALKNFEKEYNLSEDSVVAYFLDLLEHRDISNEITQRFNVVHQSPQLLLIKKGKSVYNTSHSDIDAEALASEI
ncbi:bacillithiol system redox-active protein YtxJ [Flavobacterium sp. '19STA2R22 D10 B1']|uniref:bacillithiol system redox-active protein YtxJ n=1 Tax=Flavobacterium aerium TaxID=3037261 RepID=UPI00278C4349|nr:bacillithiol system redox-active protein YtxJ [Flavobacterium sp. '19STA2R22 D10 B1']